MKTAVGFVLAWSVAALAGCEGSAKPEASALVAAVDNYRGADNAYKAAAGKAVEGVACTAADVCAAKRACLAAIRPTVQGIALDEDVQKGLDAIQSAQPPDPTLAAPLAEKAKRARALLDEGHAAMHACDEQTVALVAKYRLAPPR